MVEGRVSRAHFVIATPFGSPLYVAGNEEITECEFRSRVRATSVPRSGLLREAHAQLTAYFKKRLRRFDLPLDLAGTPFQIAVWTLVSQLEAGELISYADVGRAIGAPLSHRGVAAAMGKTPYDLLIPAHRVVGADGTIKGAGPNSMRRKLLAFEGIRLRG
jgi:methylated-DNA-[protein]-cysteine S-methyltransferase